MDLCGEHGFESVAFSTHRGMSCPACDQIEELTRLHETKIDEMQSEIDDLKSQIEELQEDK